MNWGRFKGYLNAAKVVGVGIAAWGLSQAPGIQALLNQYLVDAAQASPELATLIAQECPSCVDAKLMRWRISADSTCSWMELLQNEINMGPQWVLSGPGVGNSEPCPIDPTTLPLSAAIPLNGPSRHWPAQVKAMRERNDSDEIRDHIDRVAGREKAKAEAAQ